MSWEKPLREAAAERGLDPDAVVEQRRRELEVEARVELRKRSFEMYGDGDDDSARAFADFIANPDARVGLADRGYVAFLLREYIHRAELLKVTEEALEERNARLTAIARLAGAK